VNVTAKNAPTITGANALMPVWLRSSTAKTGRDWRILKHE